MSKFEKINGNKFGTQQYRSAKQLIEYHKQESEREKVHKQQPLCVEQYINPFIQRNCLDEVHHKHIVKLDCKPEIKTECKPEIKTEIIKLDSEPEIKPPESEQINSDDECILVVDEVICKYENIYKEPEIKTVDVKQEMENAQLEIKRKQSMKDVVKLSYKQFLKKEPLYF